MLTMARARRRAAEQTEEPLDDRGHQIDDECDREQVAGVGFVHRPGLGEDTIHWVHAPKIRPNGRSGPTRAVACRVRAQTIPTPSRADSHGRGAGGIAARCRVAASRSASTALRSRAPATSDVTIGVHRLRQARGGRHDRADERAEARDEQPGGRPPPRGPSEQGAEREALAARRARPAPRPRAPRWPRPGRRLPGHGAPRSPPRLPPLRPLRRTRNLGAPRAPVRPEAGGRRQDRSPPRRAGLGQVLPHVRHQVTEHDCQQHDGHCDGGDHRTTRRQPGKEHAADG